MHCPADRCLHARVCDPRRVVSPTSPPGATRRPRGHRRRFTRCTVGLAAGLAFAGTGAQAAPWVEDKGFFSDSADLPSSKVDAADLNGDGSIDLVFANGAGFDAGDPSSARPQQAFRNDGTQMTDVSASIFGDVTLTGRAVKLRDIDRDGDNDILLGTTWQTQSQLYLNEGGGKFINVTATDLPQGSASVGDLEVGDIDADGDLDIVLSDWGPPYGFTAATNGGGVTRLWRQVGQQVAFGGSTSGSFEDVTKGQMPSIAVRWSWDLELVDFDNDYDLDIIVSAYAGDKASLFLFANDGAGTFYDATAGKIPQGKHALDVEPMDINDDGAIDLLTLHDGVSGRNRLLLNSADAPFAFKVEPGILWPQLENPVSFDTMAAFHDHDSNGVVDFVLGAFQGQYPDRLMYDVNGDRTKPRYKANMTPLQEAVVSSGTYAIVLADFNGDTRLDVAMSQNENSLEKKVFLASEEIPLDTAAPILSNVEPLGDLSYPGVAQLRLRCHDNKSPLMLHDFKSTDGNNEGSPFIESWTAKPGQPLDDNPGTISAPGQWYGEYLWRVQVEIPNAEQMYYRVCAVDAAGNKRCTQLHNVTIANSTGDVDTQGTTSSDASTTGTDASGSTADADSASGTGPGATTQGDEGTPTETGAGSLSDTGSVSGTAETSGGSAPLVDDAGCVCDGAGPGSSGWPAWLVLPLLWRRRGRPATLIGARRVAPIVMAG